LCCNFLHVVELNKPAGKWCKECRPGHGGCSIYETRPSICRTYACGWLMSKNVSDDWYPLRSHMILSLGPLNGILTCTVSVDPRYPWIWRTEPYYSQLQLMAYNGMRVGTPEEILLVQVRCQGRVWLVTDDSDIDITRRCYIVKFVAHSTSSVELFNTVEQAAARVAELTNTAA